MPCLIDYNEIRSHRMLEPRRLTEQEHRIREHRYLDRTDRERIEAWLREEDMWSSVNERNEGKFSYQPLNTSRNEIRVLAFPTLPFRTDEPIVCTLEYVSLDEHTPEYNTWKEQLYPKTHMQAKFRESLSDLEQMDDDETFVSHIRPQDFRHSWGDYLALSYTWGSNSYTRRIVINGRSVLVTENLEAALRYVAEILRKGGASRRLKLWVDALCINQHDIIERGNEVKRMWKIFGDALSVIVYLGEEKDDSHLAIPLIREIATGLKTGVDYSQLLFNMRTQPGDANRKVYTALFRLLCRPYWRRLWIIQELAMGREPILVGCGNQFPVYLREIRQVVKLITLNVESFRMIVTSLITADEQYDFSVTIGLLWCLSRLRDMTLRSQDRDKIKYKDLRSNILNLGQRAVATDPHDKIFGLLGLMPESVSSRIEINYSLKVHEVFVSFTKAIIQATGELDVIFARNLLQTAKPSWVTDWTLPYDRSTGPGDWYFGPEEGYERLENITSVFQQLPHGYSSYKADGRKKATARFSDDGTLLFCKGFCIGNIDGVAAESPRHCVSAFPTRILQPCVTHSPYGNEAATAHALLCTLFMDPLAGKTGANIFFHIPWFDTEADTNAVTSDFNSGDRNVSIMKQMRRLGWDRLFLGNFSMFQSLRDRLGSFCISGRHFKDYFAQEVQHLSFSDAHLADEINVFYTNYRGRRLVTTNAGHFGLAPAVVERGDPVYILMGCSMPVILRQNDGSEHFEVVGECYIEGFMQGEVMTTLDSGEHPFQDITLC